MAKRGKKYLEALKKIDKTREYQISEAISLVKDIKFVKFDETIDVSVKLNLKKSHTIRDTITLPNQFSKEKVILVFAKGDKVEEAKEAGANYIGDEDLISKIKGGWLDFDIVVSTPDMMREVGKLGPILGRRGLMPNPKTGTVTNDLKNALAQLKKGRVEFRANKTGVVSLAIGKVSMGLEKVEENFKVFIQELIKRRPSDLKGTFINSIYISSTMGPSIKIVNS